MGELARESTRDLRCMECGRPLDSPGCQLNSGIGQPYHHDPRTGGKVLVPANRAQRRANRTGRPWDGYGGRNG